MRERGKMLSNKRSFKQGTFTSLLVLQLHFEFQFFTDNFSGSDTSHIPKHLSDQQFKCLETTNASTKTTKTNFRLWDASSTCTQPNNGFGLG